MVIEKKVPSPGESINEVEIANWLVSDGDYVEKDQEICEIDSDKATLTISAEDSGAIKILKESEITIAVGEVICTIDTSKKSSKPKKESPIGPDTTIKSSAFALFLPNSLFAPSPKTVIEKIASPSCLFISPPAKKISYSIRAFLNP